MPVTAAIKFTQGITTDLPGRAVIGAVGAAVVMTNGDNTDVFDWTWEITTKPSASGIATGVIAAGAVPSASFTPDVVGSYLARLTVKDTAGNQAVDTRAFIVRESSQRIIPPFRGDFASLNYSGQVEGWDPAMESWLKSLDGRQPLINATSGPINDIQSRDLVDGTAAEGIQFTNVVSPSVQGISLGYSGRRLYLMAAGSAVGIANENAGSLAQNRIITGTGADETLQSGSIAWLVYDGIAFRWRLQPIAVGGAGVPVTRTLTAGAGLTGGGDLTLDRSFDVGANADGSIAVNADDIQVGVLATDAQHGLRGGGTQHALVVPAGLAGFMSGADKTKLDAFPLSAVPDTRTLTAGTGMTGGGDLTADRTFNVIAHADGSIVANANDIQVGVLATDAQHGVRGGGTQHAVATGAVAGFMSAADKTKLDTMASGAASAILHWGNDNVSATTTTRYLTPGYEAGTARTVVVQWRAPRAGTLRNLRVRQNTGAGNGLAIVYTIRINGVASILSVSMASTANDGGPDTDTVAVAAGDLVDIEVTKGAIIVTSPSDIVATVEFAA